MLEIKRKTIPILVLSAILGLTGCTANLAESTSAIVVNTTETLKEITAGKSDADSTYDAATATTITLNGNSATIKGKGVTTKNQMVTITEAGTYVIKGTLKSGQLIVDSDKKEKVRIILNGVTITNASGPGIWIKSAEKVILTLVSGTVNHITDGKTYKLAEGVTEPDAAIFSNEDLTINGNGKLIVTGNYGTGIKSKDTLLVMGGNLQITAKGHGISGKDAVGVFGGTLTLTSGEDGIHSSSQVLVKSGTVNIAAGDDGIHGDASLVVNGGTIKISKSYEGLESANITINAGKISLIAKDDGFNAAGGKDGSALGGQTVAENFSTKAAYFIKINGGNIDVNATGDGIDANGSLYFNGGNVKVNGPTSGGNGPIDYDQICEVTGGTLTIAGSAGMAQAVGSTSKQNALLIKYTAVQKAGTVASLVDGNGKTILTFTPEKNYQSLLLSSAGLEQGKKYTLMAGKTKLTEITLSKVSTSISDKGTEITTGMGGPGQGGPAGKGERKTPPTGGTPPPSGAPVTTN